MKRTKQQKKNVNRGFIFSQGKYRHVATSENTEVKDRTVISTSHAIWSLFSDGTYGGTQIPDGRKFKSVIKTECSCCALLDDGSIQTWGHEDWGGGDPGIPEGRIVKQVVNTERAFCALLEDKSVHTWGDQNWGGGDPGIPEDREVLGISVSGDAFYAQLDDGKMHCWGRL